MIDIIELIGIVGGLIILGSWLFETFEQIKKHKTLIDLKFSFDSLIGSIMLALYGFAANVKIFPWVNTVIVVIILYEIWYSIHIRKLHLKHRKRSKLRRQL